MLLNEKPDAEVTHILMDIRMPEINGVELCHELHKKYDGTIKFVALTAHVLPQEKTELLKEGFDAILSKPFREHELLSLFNLVHGGNGKNAETPELDLSTLRSMTLGDEALFQSIVNQFIEETEHDVSRLNENLSGLNAIAVREVIHKLAGRTGQMGMSSLSSQLKEIEVNLIDGRELTTLIESINRAKSEVEKALNSIKNHAFSTI
jgi:CheY-like chemotaxis protein